MEQFRKNQIVELTVERYGSEGEGIAHLPDGRVCFVAGALAGECCAVQLLKVGKTAAWGKVSTVLTPSRARGHSRFRSASGRGRTLAGNARRKNRCWRRVNKHTFHLRNHRFAELACSPGVRSNPYFRVGKGSESFRFLPVVHWRASEGSTYPTSTSTN